MIWRCATANQKTAPLARSTRRRFVVGVGSLLGTVLLARSTTEEYATATSAAKPKPSRSPEEQQFIRAIERLRGRPLTRQEANLAIDQARWFGDL